ncbi:hypothetical protein I203_100651 [Kwoniella mangroviensis CBS 8507]|uniref:uncharacterized protein n=1 Tax=Kwoniella mangroviensis CBS 8507 TaxID=1296122 RepID=UPI00080CCB7E|nr:uncharacterized protein I203_06814 [Kwoniella mangroviensis CBS 8507]OCF64230.1 hypothetical protein I203_06814 [Kwoniella mangroviensis CBS 8507]
MLPPPFPPTKRQSPTNTCTPSSVTAPSSTSVQYDDAQLKELFKEFEDYKFTEDPMFNAGLPTVFDAIKGKKMSPGLIDKTIAEAQWFYFTTRIKHISIPFSTYTSYVHRPSQVLPKPSSPPSGTQDETQTRPSDSSSLSRMDHLTEAMRMMETKGTEGQTGLTFDKLCELIKEGKAGELQGKDIPDELNPLPPSTSTLPTRLKPWQISNQASPASANFHQPAQSPISTYHDTSYDVNNSIFGSEPYHGATTDFPMLSQPTEINAGNTLNAAANASFMYPQGPTNGLSPQVGSPLSQGIESNFPSAGGHNQNIGSDSDQIQNQVNAQYLSQLNQSNIPEHVGFTPGFEYIDWAAHDDSTSIPNQQHFQSINSNNTNMDMHGPPVVFGYNQEDEDQNMDERDVKVEPHSDFGR